MAQAMAKAGVAKTPLGALSGSAYWSAQCAAITCKSAEEAMIAAIEPTNTTLMKMRDASHMARSPPLGCFPIERLSLRGEVRCSKLLTFAILFGAEGRLSWLCQCLAPLAALNLLS